MAKYRDALPQQDLTTPFLHYVGIGTEFVFKHERMRPGDAIFAHYDEDGARELIDAYYAALIRIARDHAAGVVLDVPTWDAHTARGAALGVSRSALHDFNRRAVADAVAARDRHGDLPTVIAGLIGPRDDAFGGPGAISETEAEDYHGDQMDVLAATEVDCIDAFTLPNEIEAVGMVRAARALGLPIVVSFTLGTDGNLPSGTPLRDAISFVDDRTDGYASHYLVNCVHPVHFPRDLARTGAHGRLRGIVANASSAEHADLDETDRLDSGDPADLGERIHRIATQAAHFNIRGGCCGTDMRHIAEIARHL